MDISLQFRSYDTSDPFLILGTVIPISAELGYWVLTIGL